MPKKEQFIYGNVYYLRFPSIVLP